MPDITVFRTRLPSGAKLLNNPIVLMEVLSRGTAYRDRREKRDAYQRIPTLGHYAIVEQDQAAIQVFDRQGETWSERRLDGLAAVLDLPALDLAIPLVEIYVDLFA